MSWICNQAARLTATAGLMAGVAFAQPVPLPSETAGAVILFPAVPNNNPEAVPPADNNATIAPHFVASGVTGVNLTRGSGLKWNSGTTYNSRDWQEGTDLPTAVTNNNFLTWGFTSTTPVNLTELDIRYDRSSTGPSMLAIQIAVNGGSFQTFFTDMSVNENSEDNLNIDLSAFDAVTSAQFRLVGWMATSAGGTFDLESINFTSGGTVAIGVYSEATSNVPPVVNAGPDIIVRLGTGGSVVVDLSAASVTDPNPGDIVTTTWSAFGGGGPVTFANPAVVDTTATFTATGEYFLDLTASDGVNPDVVDSLTVVVNEPLPNNPLQTNDVAWGLSNNSPDATLWILRDPTPANATNGDVAPIVDGYTVPFLQAVEFDNLNNLLHNEAGNLLGVNFGTTGTGGTIFSLATDGSYNSTLIGNTLTDPLTRIGHAGGITAITRLGGLSVSPSNNRIAVTGFDSLEVVVYDYTAGTGTGTGTLSNGRMTDSDAIGLGNTVGTEWLNNDTVLSVRQIGPVASLALQLISIDATGTTPLAVTDIGSPITIPGAGNPFVDLEYNPVISPNLYLMVGRFGGTPSVTTNTLYVLNPTTGAIVAGPFDMSSNTAGTPPVGVTNANGAYGGTARELAFHNGTSGDLLFSTFGTSAGSDLTQRARINVIPNADNIATLADDSFFTFIASPLMVTGLPDFLGGSSFNGIDSAITVPAGTMGGDTTAPVLNTVRSRKVHG